MKSGKPELKRACSVRGCPSLNLKCISLIVIRVAVAIKTKRKVTGNRFADRTVSFLSRVKDKLFMAPHLPENLGTLEHGAKRIGI